MCTYNITVSDEVVEQLEPEFDRAALGEWLQQHINEMLNGASVQTANVSPIAHSANKMKTIVAERLTLMESGKAEYVDGEEGFAQIRAKYGL